jgi:hypothetical protein
MHLRFSLSFYCYFSLQPPLAYVNQPTSFDTTKSHVMVITTKICMNRIFRQLEGSIGKYMGRGKHNSSTEIWRGLIHGSPFRGLGIGERFWRKTFCSGFQFYLTLMRMLRICDLQSLDMQNYLGGRVYSERAQRKPGRLKISVFWDVTPCSLVR